jgi:hypothetical protein
MPTLAALLKAEGLEITPELEGKLPTLTEASDEVRNLVTAKDDLLKWKQDNTDKVTGYDGIQAKYESELNEREKLAIANKDFEEQIKIRDEREKRQGEQLKLRNEQAKGAQQQTAELEIASMFSCKDTGKQFAKNFANTEIAEDGTISTSYNLNGESYSDLESFRSAASKVDYLAKQMAVAESKGPQGKGGNGGNANKQFKDMTATEKAQLANNDPTLYKQLSEA